MNANKCTQCGHINEDATRIFCQNCGTRLEISNEPPGSGAPQAKVGKPRFRRREYAPNTTGRFGAFARATLLTALPAVLIALTIQLLRQPDGIPAPVAADDSQATLFFNALRLASESRYVQFFPVPQADVNNYLASRIMVANPEDVESSFFGARFNRAFVVIQPDDFKLYVERGFVGLNVYVYITYVPESSNQGTTVRAVGGGVGRLPIHPSALRTIEKIINPVAEAIAEPLQIVRRADRVILQVAQEDQGPRANMRWPKATPAAR